MNQALHIVGSKMKAESNKMPTFATNLESICN